jgi:DNA-binding SARP family transcriptional activator
MFKLTLFGPTRLSLSDGSPLVLEGTKTRELFCFLLVHRCRPHLRETLASQLWGEYATVDQSLKHLRLQSALPETILNLEPDWIELCLPSDVDFDLERFERVVAATLGVEGHRLSPVLVEQLEAAIVEYRCDLLEGWQHEWCQCERERLQQQHLGLLRKMVAYHESQGNLELGIAYAQRVLVIDQACETTHRQLLRLYAHMGDRTAALRQYQRCALVLRAELGVQPSRLTTAIFERIRDESECDDQPEFSLAPWETTESISTVLHDLEHLVQRLRRMITEPVVAGPSVNSAVEKRAPVTRA